MGAVVIHMASVYRRISNPFALSTTSYAGHSMRSHVGGTAAATTATSIAAATASRLPRRAMLLFALPALLLLLLMDGRMEGLGVGWGVDVWCSISVRAAAINTLLCPAQDARGAGASTSLVFERLATVRDLGVLLESTDVRLAAETRRKHPVLLVSEIFFS